jgi:hypothetical protein
MSGRREMAGPNTGSGVAKRLCASATAVMRNLRMLRESAVFDPTRPRTDPLLPRGVERLLLRFFGRPVQCAACGRQLFLVLPIVWRGEVWLIGAYDHLVSSSFTSSETLEFRHGRLDQCPAPDRPWVR